MLNTLCFEHTVLNTPCSTGASAPSSNLGEFEKSRFEKFGILSAFTREKRLLEFAQYTRICNLRRLPFFFSFSPVRSAEEVLSSEKCSELPQIIWVKWKLFLFFVVDGKLQIFEQADWKFRPETDCKTEEHTHKLFCTIESNSEQEVKHYFDCKFGGYLNGALSVRTQCGINVSFRKFHIFAVLTQCSQIVNFCWTLARYFCEILLQETFAHYGCDRRKRK